LISFAFVGIFLESYSDGMLRNTKFSYTETDTVFLLGTSYVGQINAKAVENTLLKNEFEVSVYNLKNNRIFATLNIIDDIIESQPRLVVYGIGWKDIGLIGSGDAEWRLDDRLDRFGKDYAQEIEDLEHETGITSIPDCNFTSVPQTPLFLGEIQDHGEVSLLFKIIHGMELHQNIPSIFVQNPKDATLDILLNIFGESQSEFIVAGPEKTKLEMQTPNWNTIVDQNFPDFQTCMDWIHRDNEIENLYTILEKLHENEITTVVFIPPYSDVYLNKTPLSVRSELTNNIKTISDGFDMKFYDFSSKFKDLPLFADVTHIAQPEDGSITIYNDEIAELIMRELP